MQKADKADCLFRLLLGAGFIVTGILYIPWLALLGAAVCLSLLLSCRRFVSAPGMQMKKDKKGHG
jgi:hypothetical protein